MLFLKSDNFTTLNGLLKSVLSIAFCLILFLPCKAQSPYFTKISSSNGLKSSTVYKVQQDKEGFVWMTTDRGAQRFDGLHLKDLKWSNGDVVNEEILDLKILNGNYLFLTFTGDMIQSTKLQNAKRIKLANEDVGFLSDIIYLPKQKQYLVTTSRRFVFFLNNEFKVIKKKRFSTHIRKLTEYNGEIIALAQTGIYRIEDDSLHQITRLEIGNNTRRYAVRDNEIIISQNETLKVYDLNRKTFIIDRVSPPLGVIIGLEINGDKIYALTRNGVKVIDYNSLTIERVWMESISITDLAIDWDGGLWLTSLYNGAFYTKYPDGTFYKIDDSESLRKATTVHLSTDSVLWIGGSGNNYKRINLISGKSENFSYTSYNTDRITDIIAVNSDIWILSKNALIVHRSGGTASTVYPFRGNCLMYDGRYVWLGGISLLKIDPNEVYKMDPLKIPAEEVIPYNFIYEEKIEATPVYDLEMFNGEVFAGTLSGLFRFTNGKMKEVTALKNTRINSLCAFNNDLFVGAQNNGFNIYNKNGSIKKLIDSGVSKIQDVNSFSVNNGSLFVFGNNQILQLIPNKRKTYNSEVVSLVDYQINRGAVHQNDFFLSTAEGVFINSYTKENDYRNSINLYIDSLVVNGKKRSLKRLKLDYKTNSLTLHTTVVTFSKLFGNNYTIKYRLNGNDSKWLVSNDSKIDIPYLPYGENQLILYAENDFHKTKRYVIDIYVARPFWLTNWFFILCALSVLVAGYFLWVTRVNKLRKEHRVAEELNTAKQNQLTLENEVLYAQHQALRMQMNPHFIFNAINTIKGFYAEDRKKEGMIFINNFSKLLRQILESDKKYISVEQEVSICSKYLELAKIRFGNNLEYNIELKNITQPETILIPPMLIQPFIENALVHAFDGEKKSNIIVTISLTDSLNIVVKDNGVGIDTRRRTRGENKSSKSIQITEKRLRVVAQEINGNASIEIFDRNRSNEKGTIVSIVLPIISKNERI